MESHKEYLKKHAELVHSMVKQVVDDITDEEGLVTIASSPNHICWLTGHLVATGSLAASVLGGKVQLPDGWAEVFKRGSVEPTKGAGMPSMTTLRAELYRVQGEVMKSIEASDDRTLGAQTHISPQWQLPTFNAVLFLLAHDFYHGGQIAMIRRALGRERMFG